LSTPTELTGLIIGAAISSGTPVLLATTGEILGQRSGVVNLGLEGAMLSGAVTSAWVCYLTNNVWLACAAGALAGSAFGIAHASLVVWAKVGMLASGLCLFFIGRGLSAFCGYPVVGQQLTALNNVRIPLLSDLPVIGTPFFQHDALVYCAAALAIATWYLLFRTRWGLLIRAVGEDSDIALAEGVRVKLIRICCVTAGAALAGLGGTHIVLGFSRTWLEGVTAGRGWVAIGLVVLARWNPLYALIVAYLFGGIVALQLNAQAAGFSVSPYILSMLPYVLTVLALAVAHVWARGSGMPDELSQTGGAS
jgi:general nucleoside transport system permease protein